ncbi:MAG: beta-ketoacyl synthase N-terminal-like domain-containing protein, partial [Candidatus Omnitrophota bacterium]
MKRRVVITGMGIVTSLGVGVQVTAAALKEGRPAIGTIASFDPSPHKTKRGGEVGAQALDCMDGRDPRRCLDRSSRLL